MIFIIKYILNTLNIDRTIMNNVLIEYEYPWDFIVNLEEIILKVGRVLDKNEFEEITNNVWVHKTANVDKTARIVGPCIIDEGAEIRVNAYIRGKVVVGKNCVVGNSTEIKNSVLFDSVKVPHFNYVGDSILGYNSHLGAGAIISNVKSNCNPIRVVLGGTSYNIDCKKFGSIIGDSVEVGCNSVVLPGTIIGSDSIIYPLVMVRGEIRSQKIVKSPNDIVDRF